MANAAEELQQPICTQMVSLFYGRNTAIYFRMTREKVFASIHLCPYLQFVRTHRQLEMHLGTVLANIISIRGCTCV